MRSSITNQYSALEISAEVIRALPKPVAAAWTKAVSAQQEWRKAKNRVAEAKAVREAAGVTDLAMERSLRDKVDDALIALINAEEDADTAERVFLARLHDHRAEMVEGFKLQAAQELEEANAALRTLQDRLDKFGLSLTLWNWSRRDEEQMPPSQGGAIYLRQYGVWAAQALQEISSQMDKEHPDSVQAAEEAYAREWAIANGRATPDGLVLNDAAYRAYAG